MAVHVRQADPADRRAGARQVGAGPCTGTAFRSPRAMPCWSSRSSGPTRARRSTCCGTGGRHGGALPWRRCQRRGGVRQVVRPRPGHQGRGRDARSPPTASPAAPRSPPCCPSCLEERSTWLYGEQPPAHRAAVHAGQRAVGGPGDARTRGCAGSASLARPRRRCSPTCWVARRPGTSPSGRSATRCRSGSDTMPGTMTLETRWPRLLVTDYLDQHTAPHRTDLIRVISGSAPAVVEFAPRPEFGQVACGSAVAATGCSSLGTSDPMVLRSPGVAWEIIVDGGHAVGAAPWSSRSRTARWCWNCAAAPRPVRRTPCPRTGAARLSGAHWSRWLGGPVPAAVQTALVGRSALTLRALCTPTPAPSWPPPPRRCPSRSAASATGTTGTAGCATRR